MNKKKPTFEQSINASLIWCNAWENGQLSDEVLADRVSDLLETETGARGFFVISLSSDCPLMDRLPDPFLMELRGRGELIVDLTTRNMAMSTAMAISHERDNNEEQKRKSIRITNKKRMLSLAKQGLSHILK